MEAGGIAHAAMMPERGRTSRYEEVRALALAPPPAQAGGGWEGVASAQAQLSAAIACAHATPPRPSPAFAGEGAKLAASAAPARPCAPAGGLRDNSCTARFRPEESRVGKVCVSPCR